MYNKLCVCASKQGRLLMWYTLQCLTCRAGQVLQLGTLQVALVAVRWVHILCVDCGYQARCSLLSVIHQQGLQAFWFLCIRNLDILLVCVNIELYIGKFALHAVHLGLPVSKDKLVSMSTNSTCKNHICNTVCSVLYRSVQCQGLPSQMRFKLTAT